MSHRRDEFQRLAEERLAEAKLLFAQGRPSGAYYLAGYAEAARAMLEAIDADQEGLLEWLKKRW
jgi:hypothetical protein